MLVLDDYHRITSPAIHDALAFLLDHLPPRAHLILTTRADPPLPIARLRARNQLTEIRVTDLRFTLDEVATFLNQVMGLTLSAEEIAALDARTEGWIAGLQMAALSMKEQKDRAGFIKAFTGSHRFVLDYLVEEVVRQQTERIQAFLLRTSILDRLTACLCDAMLDASSEAGTALPESDSQFSASQQILEHLEKANLFIMPLDDERRWYRYHQLFADLLRFRLQQAQPNQVIELHRRAAGWFEQNGFLEDAIRHALAAKDYELATRLIGQVRDELWGRGEVLTMLNWFKRLPTELIRSQPRNCLSYSNAFAVTGQLEAAEQWLQIVEDYAREPQANSTEPKASSTFQAFLLNRSLIGRSMIARFRGNIPDALTFSQRVIDATSKEDSRTYSIALLVNGHAHFYAGNTDAANRVLTDALQTNRASGHVAAFLNASHHLAQLRVLQGQLREAKAIYAQAAEFVAELPPVFVGIERVGLGDLAREQNDLKTACAEINAGLQWAEAGGDIFFLRDAYLARARLAQAQRDWNGALAFIQKAEQIARRSPTSADIPFLQAWRARVQIAQGDISAAAAWAETCRLSANDDLDFRCEFAHMTFARVLLSQGKPREAERFLERLRHSAHAAGRIGRVIEMLAAQAIAQNALGEKTRGRVTLEHALELAEPAGYVRVFVDEGEPIRLMISGLTPQIESSCLQAYAAKLLAGFESDSKSEISNLKSGLLFEPLGERELEVLRLLAAGKSNTQIAEQLVIATGTVKKHLSNIFGKLSAQNRTGCVARARELRLL